MYIIIPNLKVMKFSETSRIEFVPAHADLLSCIHCMFRYRGRKATKNVWGKRESQCCSGDREISKP